LTAENQKKSTTAPETGAAAMGATPVVAAEELDPGRERRPLESYFQEIGGTRTLKREEEVFLAKDLEAATAELRTALYLIPSSATHVVARWDALRALSHTGAKLSESVGDEETGEIAARVERAVKKLRTLRDERTKKFNWAGGAYSMPPRCSTGRSCAGCAPAADGSQSSKPRSASARSGCWSSWERSRTRTSG
jgi:hypothetical protein